MELVKVNRKGEILGRLVGVWEGVGGEREIGAGRIFEGFDIFTAALGYYGCPLSFWAEVTVEV